MSIRLPLQIRKDIRDVFEEDDSQVKKSFRKLGDIIGYTVSCDPEWHMLWTELEHAYPDKATFCPSISKVVESWSDALARRLEDEKFEAWAEILLESLKSVMAVRLLIQIGDGSRISTTWSNTKSSFIILLPKSFVPSAGYTGSLFAEDFERLFDPSQSAQVVQDLESPDDEGWAELTSNADDSRQSTQPRMGDSPSQPCADAMPCLQTLPRPEILFQKTIPYLMHVSATGTNKITVNGTHEPSLRLLAEYLTRWIKTDPQDVRKIPLLRIKLQESNFGLGLFYDSLTIEPFDHHQRHVVTNSTLILGLIEGVLGYQAVPENSGPGYWEFKRFTAFRAT